MGIAQCVVTPLFITELTHIRRHNTPRSASATSLALQCDRLAMSLISRVLRTICSGTPFSSAVRGKVSQRESFSCRRALVCRTRCSPVRPRAARRGQKDFHTVIVVACNFLLGGDSYTKYCCLASSRGSSVSTVSDYRLGDRGSIRGRGKGMFL